MQSLTLVNFFFLYIANLWHISEVHQCPLTVVLFSSCSFEEQEGTLRAGASQTWGITGAVPQV